MKKLKTIKNVLLVASVIFAGLVYAQRPNVTVHTYVDQYGNEIGGKVWGCTGVISVWGVQSGYYDVEVEIQESCNPFGN